MTLPFIQLLIALKDELVDALDGVTTPDGDVTVRHHRHRESREDEWPCVAIRYVSNDVSSTAGREETDTGMPEQVWELSVDLVIDCALPVEGDEGDADIDPTGYATPAIAAQACIDHLFPGDGEPTTLGGLAWDSRYDGTAAEGEDSNPDAIRMVERLVLLYRVEADRPTVLLTGNQ